jgi:hypothetical protein
LICSDFGPKVVQPQLIVKALPTLFEAKQVPVREGVKKLVVSINVALLKCAFSSMP